MGQELEALQEVIQDIHSLMTVMKDPEATSIVSQCLTQLVKLQKTMMQPQQGSPQQAIAQRLTGGGGAGY